MPDAAKSERYEIREAGDIVRIRQAVRREADGAGLGLIDQTKLVTAASELARNALDHAGGGRMDLDLLERGGRRGLRLTFEDEGPGIPDLDRALQSGYSTGAGLGLGLGGAARLVNDFEIENRDGGGVRVRITRWGS